MLPGQRPGQAAMQPCPLPAAAAGNSRGGKTMKIIAATLLIDSHEKLQLIDVSGRVRDWVKETKVHVGLLSLFSLHTTAGLLLNENQDALVEDIREFLKKIVDDQ